MSENDGILDPRERVRCRSSGDRPVVVLVQVAAADAVINHAQLDVAGAGLGFWNRFKSEVAWTIKNRGAHKSLSGDCLYGNRGRHRALDQPRSLTLPAGNSPTRQNSHAP